MNKRIVIVICIAIAALSFMGGMIYKYEDYVPLVEVDLHQNKYVFKYNMPLDKETAVYWFGWAAYEYHQYIIDYYSATGYDKYNDQPFEFHRDAIAMYEKMKELYLAFDEKWNE